jgi:selenocysteine lyase/cysteine desulfurase
VLERAVYLNAGTDGPLPARAGRAVAAEIDRELSGGRARAHFERRRQLADDVRARYAELLGCPPEHVALTTSTTEGMGHVVAGLGLQAGDEILTSTEEHPGLIGALAAARDLLGVSVREVPFAEIDAAVGERTRLIACSHVSWMSGRVAPPGLAEVDVPVLLDGAQGIGAIPVDVAALGCDAYAGAGQKWLCGPDGLGQLYVAPALRERLAVTRRGYGALRDPGAGLDAGVHEDARCFDAPALSAETLACGAASLDVLAEAGWADVHGRARALASLLESHLLGAGYEVVPRSDTTLVSFAPRADPEAERDRLADAGIVLRNIPGRPWLRASVGAWNDEGDLDRLMATLSDNPSTG